VSGETRFREDPVKVQPGRQWLSSVWYLRVVALTMYHTMLNSQLENFDRR
jgi:hypothetical protein